MSDDRGTKELQEAAEREEAEARLARAQLEHERIRAEMEKLRNNR